NLYVNYPSKTHHMLIDTIVKDFFDQNINPIVLSTSIAQLADIHPGPQPDMFPPIEGFYTLFCILIVFCHLNCVFLYTVIPLHLLDLLPHQDEQAQYPNHKQHRNGVKKNNTSPANGPLHLIESVNIISHNSETDIDYPRKGIQPGKHIVAYWVPYGK